MAELFGRRYTRRELLARVGDMGQLAGIKRHDLTDGPARGVAALDFWTGSGLCFTVLPGRCMDIEAATYGGRSLCYRSGTGVTHPGLFESDGLKWLRTFFGGLLTTCGLRYIGAPCEDEGETLGLHGLIANTAAREVSTRTWWDGDEYYLSASGVVREASVLQYDLVMRRTITTRLGATTLTIHDEVENLDGTPSPHMILYHVNLGFPVVDDGAELVVNDRHWEPRDAVSEDGKETHRQFHEPVAGYAEKVYFHDPAPDNSGRWTAAVVNERFNGGEGLGVYVRCDKACLPNLIQWKMMGQHTYVVGVEPASCPLASRDEMRAKGELPMIEPGEVKTYDVEIGVAAGTQAVQTLRAGIEPGA